MAFASLEIEAEIMAKLPKVWSYWTSPEHITKWNFAAPSWCCPKAANDLRPGGAYFARMEARDGSVGFDLTMIHEEVQERAKLVSRMSDGRRVCTTFLSTDRGTKVKTVFDAETQNPLEMQQAGWQSILNNFKAYTEQV